MTPGAPDVSTWSLEGTVPWNKFADFVRGVILPLEAEGATVEADVTVRLTATGPLNEATIDTKARETLRQIGVEIAEEEMG